MLNSLILSSPMVVPIPHIILNCRIARHYKQKLMRNTGSGPMYRKRIRNTNSQNILFYIVG